MFISSVSPSVASKQVFPILTSVSLATLLPSQRPKTHMDWQYIQCEDLGLSQLGYCIQHNFDCSSKNAFTGSHFI